MIHNTIFLRLKIDFSSDSVIDLMPLESGHEFIELAKISLMDKLKSKLNIVSSQPKVEKAFENKVKTPELAR